MIDYDKLSFNILGKFRIKNSSPDTSKHFVLFARREYLKWQTQTSVTNVDGCIT